jgi:glycosyltransferase involved in cell wall biosynthesis
MIEKSKHLLIIGFVFPEPASSAAGSRMMQLIDLFKSQGFQITFASPASDSEFAVDIEKLAIKKVSIILNDASFDHFVTELNPDIVLFDRFMMEEQFGWRVSENCPNAIRILDTEDLHCLRLARQNAWKLNVPFENEMLFNDVAKREIASILRCDLSLIISEFEMDILQNIFQISPAILHYLPLFIDEELFNKRQSLPTFNERKHFIFIGNFLHEPNWNAVLYLKESIWTKIKEKLPETELHIYGSYSSQKVLNLRNQLQGFIIKNRAEEVYEAMKTAKVCLAPLRFGAGIKGKLLDAMIGGTPNGTTSIGAESMHGKLPWSGFISDDIDDFVASAVELYTNEISWKQAQINGFEICEKRYLKKIFESDFSELINQIEKNIVKRRQNNFMGEILKHHTVASTRYMSKWIEEKNKK